jgi:hypothetical protein
MIEGVPVHLRETRELVLAKSFHSVGCAGGGEMKRIALNLAEHN